MELLVILIGVVMIGGVLIVPALLRMRGGRGAQREAVAADPQNYGFVPVDQLDIRLPGPDQELDDALEEIRRTGSWRPAAQLLALTDASSELRWQRVQTLAGAAALELARAQGEPGASGSATAAKPTGPSLRKEGPSLREDGPDGPGGGGGVWLRTWRVEAADDPGGAAVHAEFLVRQAMRTPDSQDYQMILEEARTVCREAARLAPGDPVPHIVELGVARGLGYRQPDFEELWAKVKDRAPQHMGAHLAALHYWCEKWHGSQALADGFAQSAASGATKGSLLPALPLFAVFEHLPEANLVRGLYQSVVVTRAVAGALYAVEEAPSDHPVLPHVRHLLVWFLVRAERYAEAVGQLQRVDGHVGALPWSYGADPAAEYAAYRALAVAGWESQGGNPASASR